jgi:hypothetical protein
MIPPDYKRDLLASAVHTTLSEGAVGDLVLQAPLASQNLTSLFIGYRFDLSSMGASRTIKVD